MCTVVILRRPESDWPLILAANRDEMVDRPWLPPGRHWTDRPEVVAGLDQLAGGSWIGLNDHGVVAAVLNRIGSLGPQAGKRSRGELVLEALDSTDAASAADQLRHLEPSAYRSFNMVVCDNRDAFWLRNLGRRDHPVDVFPLGEGVSMLTAHDLNDRSSDRIARHLTDFQSALAPEPDLDDWEAWQDLLGRPAEDDPLDAMTIDTETGFETVSSSLIALPGPDHTIGDEPVKPQWLFAAGRPDRFPYQPVAL